MIHGAQIQIRNVRLFYGECIELVQRLIAFHLLVEDFIFLPAASNIAHRHLAAVRRLIRHRDLCISHPAAGCCHSKRRQDAGA